MHRSTRPRAAALAAAAALTVPALLGAAPPAPVPASAAVRTGVQGPSRWDACADTALTLTFPGAPVAGGGGTVTVTDLDTGAVADRIQTSDPASALRAIGGATNADGSPHQFHYAPVTIDGDTALIHLHHQLAYGHRYRATVAPGVLDGTGNSPLTWTFRTRSRPAGGHTLTVDSQGHGDFCTVQGAIDAVPAGNTRPVTIRVHPGTYTELDWVPADKPHLTVEGTGPDPAATVLRYTNNDNLNSRNATGVCPRQMIPGHDDTNCWRASFNDEADDVTLRDLTLHNTTPYGGSQAEAFRGNADRVVLDRVRLLSYQDTLRLQGRGFVDHSYIAGDVDFTWGFGAVLIQDSELRSLHAGYVTQVRNDAGHPGYVFLRDRLTADDTMAPGSVWLGRIDPDVFPYSQVAFIDTAMGPQIAPAGWQLNNSRCGSPAAAHVRFWEYRSTGLTGAPLDTSARLSCATQLTAAQAAVWSDPATVLSGWNPERR